MHTRQCNPHADSLALSLLHLGKADGRPGSSSGSNPLVPAAAAAEATQTAVDAPLLALVFAPVVVGPDDPVLLDLGPKLIALFLFLQNQSMCERERLKQCT